MLYKHWGPTITGFFCDCHESVEILYQLMQIATNGFNYVEAVFCKCTTCGKDFFKPLPACLQF